MPKTKKSNDRSLLSEQHDAALGEYEKGIRLLQQKDFQKAIPRFEAVLETYGHEQILCDRARMYLRICRQDNKDRAPLRTTREPGQSYEVGVYLLNEGEYKEAVRHLERAAEHAPKDAGVRITLASARLGGGDPAGAKNALRDAIALDSSVKHLARTLSDFDDLDDDPEFNDIVA